MKDMQAQLENLHVQIAECEMIRDLATNPRKRALFGRLAEHYKVLAGEIEKTMADGTSSGFVGRKARQPSSKKKKA